MSASRPELASQGGGKGILIGYDKTFTLSTLQQDTVCYALDQQGGKSNCGVMENIMPTILSDSHGTPRAVCYSVENPKLQAFDARGNQSSCGGA